jgi:protein subunit release factor B
MTDQMLSRGDVQIEFYRSSGPGGQRKNKKDTAVRVTHLPTGISATAAESRYRSVNLKRAFERLAERVEERARPVVPRVRTRPPRAAGERRLETKRIVSVKKDYRRPVGHEE